MPTGQIANIDINEITTLYQDGYSCNQIADKIGYSESVVWRRLKKAGIPFRSQSESLKKRFEKEPRKTAWVEKVCLHCNKPYQVKKRRARRRKFCSVRCGSLWRRDHGLLQQKQPRPFLICKACGQKFQVKYPYQAKTQQFCSVPCARYYQHIHDRRYANTTIELIVQALLVGLDICFSTQWRLDSFTADIYLPDHNKAIECDGKYWHSLPITVKTDSRKERVFATANVPVLHLVEDKIMSDIEDCKTKILEFLSYNCPL